jgi:tetratricopeptide (TPR) repeat protein
MKHLADRSWLRTTVALGLAIASVHTPLWAQSAGTPASTAPASDAALPGTAVEGSSPTDGDRKLRSQVDHWVEQLGAANYAERLRARLELERLGLLAFDALYEAQFADDSEIALAARYLIGSLQVSWSNPEDPEVIRGLLEGYGSLVEADRQARIERLTLLPDRIALPALCRLARFESSPRLSRRAALAVLRLPAPTSEAEQQRVAALITEVLGPNDRSVSTWLRLRSEEWLVGDLRSDDWRQLLADERTTLDSGGQGTTTDKDLVRDLYRSVAERAVEIDDPSAPEFAMASLDLIDSDDLAVVDAVNWALNHRLDPMIEQLQVREAARFEREPRLLYALADVARRRGDDAAAKQFSDQALALAPPPANAAGEALDEALYRHTEMGVLLQERGWFDWSQRELQLVIDAAPPESLAGARARIQLSSLQEALEDFPAAIKSLEPLVQRIQADDAFATRIKDLLLVSEPSELVSQWHFLQGRQAMAAGDDAAAKQHLVQATEEYPDNIEALIAMHGLAGDAGWKTRGQMRVAACAKRMRESIDWLGRMLNTPQGGSDRAGTAAFLAMRCNQYAWLIANTEGDIASAIEHSQKALDLQPGEPAYLDTLARALFASGDLAGAIEAQRRALVAQPHWPPLKRQMEELLQQPGARELAPGPAER